MQGAQLDANCSPCVTKVCQKDNYCCNGAWDDVCAYQVLSECGTQCPNSVPPATCDSLYGKAKGYQLCKQSNQWCEFSLNAENAPSCQTVCAGAGGNCMAVVNDQNNQKCQYPANPSYDPNTCGQHFGSAICICSRGCGGGAGCKSPQQCQGGKCQ